MPNINTGFNKKMVRGSGDKSRPYQVMSTTPIPRRDVPLEGTKSMNTPEDKEFGQKMAEQAAMRKDEPSPVGIWMGKVAFFASLVWLLVFAYHSISGAEFSILWIVGAAVILHLLVIFSQLLTHGIHTLGVWSLAVMYGGFVVVGFLEILW